MPPDHLHSNRTRIEICCRAAAAVTLIACFCIAARTNSRAAPGAASQEWPFYGGDSGGAKYSSLDQINRGNVTRLQLAWEWKTGEAPLSSFKAAPGVFEATPLMIGNTLYLSTAYNRVVALDGETGHEKWSYDPKAYERGPALNGNGWVHRGVAAWSDHGRVRMFLNSRTRLISLDAQTGRPVLDFGDNGEVDLARGLLWEVNAAHYTNTSPPVVFKDLVIVGNGVPDVLIYKNDPPGDVRAFDARTGKLAWTFHTIPQKGEYGNETWENGSEKITGHVNVWAPMTLDAERGLLYLPVSTPSNDFYGGRRWGANLFADSLVCLDAGTGRRKWHRQLVHHGLWDYDMPAPPSLVTITVNGKKIDAVAQLTKMGFVFVFDRVTGEPVWPIEERATPASDVPGERAWPRQPFPTRPPAIEQTGVSLDDAFDLTPELKAEAQAEMKKYRLGSIFTPPSVQGTIMRPGVIGGANWGGGAFDPETAMLYVKTTNMPSVIRLTMPTQREPAAPTGNNDAEYIRDRTIPNFPQFHDGLPLVKPPYGHLTAVNLNTGEIAWQTVFGDSPELRAHPALKGVKLPDRLGAIGAPGCIVTKGGLIFIGGGDAALHAVDKTNGRELWSYPLAQKTGATPMTYRSADGRQFVVVAAGSGANASLLAFALPQR
jgi:quinoprotein glucose dehydrogenase